MGDNLDLEASMPAYLTLLYSETDEEWEVHSNIAEREVAAAALSGLLFSLATGEVTWEDADE